MDKGRFEKTQKSNTSRSLKRSLKDIDALAKHEKNGDMDNAELIRRRIRKGSGRCNGSPASSWDSLATNPEESRIADWQCVAVDSFE